MERDYFDKLHEECGVFGVLTRSGEGTDVAHLTYRALYALQHRGQESCGIAINDDGVITGYKDVGLVNEVFTEDVMRRLPEGQMAIGHCRYGTTGGRSRENAQPMVIRHIKGGMAVAHNGNLTNASELREGLEMQGAIFSSTSDSEVISYIITRERLRTGSIQAAVSAAMDSLKGAYSLAVMSPRKLIAARDPLGFHPLCIGELEDGWAIASESCALDAIGAKFLRDVEPGEIVTITRDGLESDRSHCGGPTAECVFEFIYFARPDSVVDGSCVHTARQRAGAFLALEHPVQADVVIGVPDSGLDAALGYARQSGIPYGVGFVKNKYIGRTFIQPGQARRENAVRIKLNAIASTVRGKRVILVDDSIVRGTTIAHIVELLREAGATEVHVRLSAPPFLYPCYFGTDIDSRDNLIAANHTIEEIRDIIGVDSVGYLSCDSVHKLADNSHLNFCAACFTGEYPCEIPKRASKNRFEQKLSERSKDKEDA